MDCTSWSCVIVGSIMIVTALSLFLAALSTLLAAVSMFILGGILFLVPIMPVKPYTGPGQEVRDGAGRPVGVFWDGRRHAIGADPAAAAAATPQARSRGARTEPSSSPLLETNDGDCSDSDWTIVGSEEDLGFDVIYASEVSPEYFG